MVNKTKVAKLFLDGERIGCWRCNWYVVIDGTVTLESETHRDEYGDPALDEFEVATPGPACFCLDRGDKSFIPKAKICGYFMNNTKKI